MNKDGLIEKAAVRQRVIACLLVGASLTLCFVLLWAMIWHGSATLNAAMAAIAALLTLLVAAMALARFYSGKNGIFLLVGAGLLGIAILQGYHAAAMASAFAAAGPSDLPQRMPASWLASQQFLVAMLMLSWFACLREDRLGDADRPAKDEAEAAFAELAAHQLALNEHAIVAAIDAAGTITYANDRYCKISKYPRNELIGRNRGILRSGHHPESFYQEIHGTIENGRIWRGEIKNHAKDGSHYWVDTTIVPFKDARGAIVQYVVIQTDITGSKITEAVLQTNADVLNATFNNFPGGISVFNKDLVLQTANPAFYRLLDLPSEMFQVGSPYEEIVRYLAEHAEFGDGDVETLVRERVETASKFEKRAFKRKRPGGKSLEIRSWPLSGGGFINIYTDITSFENLVASLEEKTNEAVSIAEDLRRTRDIQNQTHQHLLTSVNSMRNGFAIWDADDRLVLANDAYQQFHDPIGDMIVEELKFDDMLSAGFDNGVWDIGGRDKESWLREQMAERRKVKESETELQIADGRQIIKLERVLDNGDVITTLIDATAHREREMELQHAKYQLEQIAYIDGLTGLANRTHCQKDLAEKFAFVAPDSKFAVIQIDLDNFKRVNDTMGHAAGDHLLWTVGERLNLLASDFSNFKPYRWGGDEFIALVERNANTNLEAICQELTDVVSIPAYFGKATLRPTVSIGVARYPEDAQDLEELMIFADLALYKTKELGRDGYLFFTFDLKEEIDAESRIEHELRIAIEEQQFELYYQPQISVSDEAITGLEVLLRWRHPQRGIIAPGEFLPVVEGSGLASAVGRMVFDDAMAAGRRWVDEGLEFGRLAINLSPEHLRQDTVLDDFFGSMEKHGLEPHYLAVEFLESFLFDDPNSDIMNILKKLRASGIHVELDDFGTGYASLSHLSAMPINGLKIDRSFVQQIVNDQKQQVIVSSLISLSKFLDLRVVCEGIETWQQMAAIAEIGKCAVQGYFIAKPMSFSAATEWITGKHNIGILKGLPGGVSPGANARKSVSRKIGRRISVRKRQKSKGTKV